MSTIVNGEKGITRKAEKYLVSSVLDDGDDVTPLSADYGVTTANLNDRTGHGVSYSIITTLSKGTTVEIGDSMGRYYQDGYWWVYVSTVTGTRVSGWAAEKYISIVES